ncbi:MAG: methyltransferase domain-containing protein [Bacteroidia bacterium]|nr:methyltransferase domain-containing protein [Bacteroidia bacterium]
MSEENEYILGTDREELFRLGIQHQVWASEAQHGWKLAGFTSGQTILDLGCGPGFCTKELAFVVGPTGKVIGVDRSKNYIDYVDQLSRLHGLPIETIHTDFDNMDLAGLKLDGMYCRWALAWIPNPGEILSKIKERLKPGGRMVIHEYYDWSTHQTSPAPSELATAIQAALKSFKDMDSEIDIGRHIPQIAREIGLKVVNLRLISKLGTPSNSIWHWPKSFYHTYFPRLVETGYLSQKQCDQALMAMDELEKNQEATLCCPLMIEIVLEK